MSGMVDPLNNGVKAEVESEGDGSSSDRDVVPLPEASLYEGDQASAVLKWSTEKVKSWFQENVPFEPDRMQEFLHTFENEGIDGLGLLTLQRCHRACAAMSESEWLLLKASRRRLLIHGEKAGGTPLNKITVEEVLGAMTPPSTPPSIKTNGHFGGLRDSHSHDHGLFGSPRKWSIPGLRWGHAKDDQLESLKEEVQSLRGEIVGAEERETTLQAQLDHLDEMLRNCELSGYIHTRTRWTALPGEPPILDDTDVDDWMLRFLVLRGSNLCFYLRATDLRPQGTILLNEIVEAGPIPRKMHHKGDRRWSAFHITTCHGLRLECSSTSKVQVDSWLTSIGSKHVKIERRKSEDPHRPLSGAWLKVLPLESDDLTQECDLFGEKTPRDEK